LLFGDVVRKDFLPEDRAAGCEREYIQLCTRIDPA
jgi:hypothetical protein